MTTTIVPQTPIGGKSLSLLELASLQEIAEQNRQDAEAEAYFYRQQENDEKLLRSELTRFLPREWHADVSAVTVLPVRHNYFDCPRWVVAAWCDEILFGYLNGDLVVLRPFDDGRTYNPSCPLRKLTDLLDAYREEPIPLMPYEEDHELIAA